MKNLLRVLSCLMIGILCAALLAGCSGSSAGSEDDAESTGDTEAAEEEDAGTEDEAAKTSADYTTLTISTYTVDDSGNQELVKTEIFDGEGNILDSHVKGTSYEYGDYEYVISYSYNADGFLSGYTVDYTVLDLYISGVTAEYEYQYDDNGVLCAILGTFTKTWTDGDFTTWTFIADPTYNTEGYVSTVILYPTDESYCEDGVEMSEESGYTSDGFYGLLIDFTYYFEEITEVSISQGIFEEGVDYGDEIDVYSRLLEYNSDGQITLIEHEDTAGYPTDGYLNYEYDEICADGIAQLFYRVLEYMDSLQDTHMASLGSYILYGTFSKYSSSFICDKIESEYDSQGNRSSLKFYQYQQGSAYDNLNMEYAYEYEYDEYGRILTKYSTKYDSHGHIDETCVSYYEYE